MCIRASRNRVHVAEQCFDQFQKPKLQRKAFRVFALEIKPADIVRFPRGYVRQHRDHSDAAQSQQGKDLVVVSKMCIRDRIKMISAL